MFAALSAVLSFLGGNAFRLIFGEVVSFLSKKQAETEMGAVGAEMMTRAAPEMVKQAAAA